MTPTDLWQFHQTPYSDDPENGLVMSRPSGVCTVSMSQIDISNHSQTIDFQYYELESNTPSNCSFEYGFAETATQNTKPATQNNEYTEGGIFY